MAQPERLNFNTNVEISPSRDYQPADVKLSVIMPVFNEVWTLAAIVERVLANPICYELIIVDDGSTDGSRDLLGRMDGHRIKRLYHDTNRGKGAAIRTGLQHVSGDVVIIQDADLEYDPQDYDVLLAPLEEGIADAVYGSRFEGAHCVLSFWQYAGNRFLTSLTNLLYNGKLTDMETCYKAIRVSFVEEIPLRSNRFDIEAEITAKLLKRGARLCEVPIKYVGRTYQEGKKIGWRDGIQAIWTLIRYRFSD